MTESNKTLILIEDIRLQAKKRQARIVFPEGEDERTIRATNRLDDEEICRPILMGDPEKIIQKAQTHKIPFDEKSVEIVDPKQSSQYETYSQQYFELRKHKQITESDAYKKMLDPLFFGAMMIRNGDADGGVTGAVHATGDVLRAGIQCIGVIEGLSLVSSCFLMLVPNWPVPLTFADAGVVPDPNAEQLACIAIASANTHKKLTKQDPIVAMLSFSTKGSAQHERVDKVCEAVEIAKKLAPDLLIDGELQGDAALVADIGNQKAPGSPVAGRANVLIFPDLDSANICYKLTQRLACATALGPLVQGLVKPFMDLSRGCSADDIVDVAAICAVLGA
ncbi:phosphate acetyltransferase [candidate division KSB1 bacterium]|nr:phosphate acetyltransferase [candidate division KSB1 bacterium]